MVCIYGVSNHKTVSCHHPRIPSKLCPLIFFLLSAVSSWAKLNKDLFIFDSRQNFTNKRRQKGCHFHYMFYTSQWKLTIKFILKIPYIHYLRRLLQFFIISPIQSNWYFTQKKKKTMAKIQTGQALGFFENALFTTF